MKVPPKSPDRISALPQDTIEKILTLMPITDAVRTSILSKKWRYCWASIPKLVFDTDMFNVSGDEELDKYKLVNAIFHVLLLRRAPILEFTLIVDTEIEICSEIDQIILHLSMRNNIKKFNFEILRNKSYLLPRSFFSMQKLEHIDLSYCIFDLPLTNYKGFTALKSLRFSEVSITNKMLFGFLTSCPLLEEFTWSRDHCINIELTEYELAKLFKCLPSVQVLKISRLYIKHMAAGSMPHKLLISLVHLRVLVLGVCFLELSTILRVITSSPNLEKVKLKLCWDRDERYLQQTFKKLSDDQDYTNLNLNYLKEMDITNFRDCASWMEFVKFIMAKSLSHLC